LFYNYIISHVPPFVFITDQGIGVRWVVIQKSIAFHNVPALQSVREELELCQSVVCVFHCYKIQIIEFLPSFSCCLTVLDCSLNCSYNSGWHARTHRHACSLLCGPFINNSLPPKTQGTKAPFFMVRETSRIKRCT
jgi:hypothetical protein